MCISVKTFAIVFGVAFVGAGVLGFVPGVTSGGLLLGLFMVDTVHNIIHLVSGVIAFLVASNSNYAKKYFQIFGVIYGVVAVLGFLLSGHLYVIHVNMADNFLHLIIAVVALYVGFFYKRGQEA